MFCERWQSDEYTGIAMPASVNTVWPGFRNSHRGKRVPLLKPSAKVEDLLFEDGRFEGIINC